MSYLKKSRIQMGALTLDEVMTRLSTDLGPKPGIVFLFLPREDCQNELAKRLYETFKCPISCCSSASTILEENFDHDCLVALSIDSDVCKGHSFFVHDLTDEEHFQQKCEEAHQFIMASINRDKLLGVMLIDGLSHKEEWVTQGFSWALQGTALVGGSSSDDLDFISTPIYFDGEFHHNSALLVILELDIDFEIFKVQHFYPTQQRFVVTKADPQKRMIYEINGEKASQKYSELINRPLKELNPRVFAEHPLAITLGGEVYIRSLNQVNSDGSISVYGAVEEGAVFRIAQADDLANATLVGLEDVRQKFLEVDAVLAFVCILRREEVYQKKDMLKKLKTYYSQYSLMGFYSYGEQYISKHVNQSLTGVFFGEKKES